MNKTTSTKTSAAGLYIFGAVLTFIMILLFFLEWGMDGWLLKAVDNKWSDIRQDLPLRLSWVTGKPSYQFAFGKYINKYGDDRITIAAIDEHTTQKYGWPFKRKYYSALMDKLDKLGVKAVGMDVVLFDPDRDDPTSDQKFADSVKRSGKVVNLLAVDVNTHEVQLPLKALVTNSRYLAYPNSDISIDKDGHVRKFWGFYPSYYDEKENEHQVTYSYLKAKLQCGKECDGVKLPVLSMATYSIYSGIPLRDLENRWAAAPIYINFKVPQVRVMHPGWSTKEAKATVYRHISVRDILEDTLSPEERKALNGGITLVGSTALASFDHFPSPFMPLFPGVELHANVIDNLVHNDTLNPVNFFIVLPFIFLLIWLPIYLSKKSIKLLSYTTFGIVSVMLVLNYYMFYKHYDMPFLSVVLALAAAFIYVTVYKAVLEGREKKWIKNTFGQYLSPKVVEIITKDPSMLKLGGEKRDMTAMFCDIASFTTISEKLTPEQLTAMLNTYLSGLTDEILKHDGVVDKFIGDCIMAFWNAPVDLKNHRTCACLAAVDCLAVNNKLNAVAKDMPILPNFRIGLNAGPMTVGNMGSQNRFSYTAIGDAVNLASRLEGANKFFHSRIMTSEDVFNEAKALLDARYLGQIRVVGKAIPVKVYEPFARKGEASPEIAKMLPLYETGVANFYAGKYKESAKDFKAALAARPEDGPSQFYIEQAEKYIKEPPKEWDGTFNLESK